MANSGVNMPAGFGGLTRYSEEYDTMFPLKPSHIVLFVILIILFRIGLGVFF